MATDSSPQEGQGRFESEQEYSVVEFRLSPTLIAYGSLLLTLGWHDFYYRFLGGPWWWDLAVAVPISLIGAFNARLAFKRQRSFVNLCALLLCFGLVAAMLLPALSFYLVLAWPF